MSNFRTIRNVASYKPLTACGMEELAARQARIKPSSGVLFVRNGARDDKAAARQMVLDLFHPRRWPGRLHILTMPSIDWRFERLLLADREEGWMRARNPRRTLLTSVENDRSIFFASVTQMPGTETPDRVIKTIGRHNGEFFEAGVKTRYAAHFFADVDDLMRDSNWSGWDAVWLDYTGPLTLQRLKLIQNFFNNFVRDTLIVTALKARWNEQTSKAIANAGSHSQWLRQHLPGEILHDIEYYDTAPMAQFAVRHPIENLGQPCRDDQNITAEIAAGVTGGTYQNLGQIPVDTSSRDAEITAAGLIPPDIHQHSACGGPNQTEIDLWQNPAKPIAPKRKRARQRKPQPRSAPASRARNAKPSRQAKKLRKLLGKKPRQPSARAKPQRSKHASKAKPNL